MAKWFETKVRYERTNEDGKVGKVTEAYMVDAITFSEAEKRSLEELAAYTTGELEVVAAKITNIAEVVAGYKDELFDGDKWYNCKLEYMRRWCWCDTKSLNSSADRARAYGWQTKRGFYL